MRHLVLGLVAAASAPHASAQDGATRDIKLSSPNGRIALRVAFPEAGTAASPRWSLAVDGKPLLEAGRMGLAVEGDGELLAGAVAGELVRRTHDELVPVPFGKAEIGRAHV